MRKSKEILEHLKGDAAEIMLESTIIIIIVLFMLIAMISVGFLFYQQSIISSIATELAEDIGANYKLISDSDSSKINLYRTSIALGSAETYHREKALEKCRERLKISSLGIAANDPEVNVDIVVDNIGRLHAEVTVTLECSILFDGALKYFGIIDSTPEFSATARGECLDVTAYAGQVHFMNYITEKAGDPNILNIVNQTVRIIRNGASIVDVFTGG